jgi:carbohydrate kinase (thermoresistant glucokinase family)
MTTPAATPRRQSPPLVLVLMGVAGAGKSAVAAVLSQRLGWELGEGDDLHPAANVSKMASGIPLTDDDRRPWLDRVAAWIGERTSTSRPAVITCSALKAAYRDRLRAPAVAFVYLHGSPEAIGARLAARRGHFLPAGLLASQFDALQPPTGEPDVLVVDVDTATADQIVDQVIVRLHLEPTQQPA